jgi:DNA-binding NarL/FixJ family response regulator
MSLSAREQTVARLAADGASNREIAAALFVSPKTVERHLTNILAKVGLRNRTELAGLVRTTVVRDSPDE